MARGEVGKDEMVRGLPFSHTQFYLLSERPPPHLFACNKQWKCIGELNHNPLSPRCICTKGKAPMR